ncbi:LysR family cyn operon transcriptional activator [Chitinophaga skermanii]|uniref:LysR family cyn operon transcriptional activator n=1 Tax=Chitinophaga skermanii TaxID=331697 RepID=A0A327QP37_9BACT|nr:LysR family transcriptional regulator [Chitinophaga skermanii]RAJ05464.1 LysR family cyn operon transcriptional activator [Chitinophaga skermanii]
MELRQLKYFLKAQALLNFTEAAQSLQISQSTLSQQIKQLEIELDTPLFNRSGRNIVLTEAGKLFKEFAQQCVGQAEAGMLMMGDLKNLRAGKISIGVSFGLKDYFIPALLAFAQQYPQVSVHVIYEPSHTLLERLAQFELDFILTFHEDVMEPIFHYEHLFYTPMVLATASHSPIAKRKHISLEEIATLPIAIATMGYHAGHTVSKAFQERQLQPAISIEVNDVPTVLDIVRTGNWHSIMVKTCVHGPGVAAIPINNGNLLRNTQIISLEAAYETKAAATFKQIIKNLPLLE